MTAFLKQVGHGVRIVDNCSTKPLVYFRNRAPYYCLLSFRGWHGERGVENKLVNNDK